MSLREWESEFVSGLGRPFALHLRRTKNTAAVLVQRVKRWRLAQSNPCRSSSIKVRLGDVSVAGAEPFLKWAGGKRLLVDDILSEIPPVADGQTYYEPFLGGGAIFFALAPKTAVLSDLNSALIETYISVRDDPEIVIDELAQLRHNKREYYRVRAWSPKRPTRRAARFIYLNKTCFNGLYRENLEGQFNVPYGRHGRSLVVCDGEQIRHASAALHGVKLRVSDFEASVKTAKAGDVVYFDPPYTTAHANNGFIEYNAKVFSWVDQVRLARLATGLTGRGVRVVISNADHGSIRKLYQDFRVVRLNRWSTIAAAHKKRYPTAELLLKARMS